MISGAVTVVSFGFLLIPLLVQDAELVGEVSTPPGPHSSRPSLSPLPRPILRTGRTPLLFVLPFFGRFPEVCHRLDFFAYGRQHVYPVVVLGAVGSGAGKE